MRYITLTLNLECELSFSCSRRVFKLCCDIVPKGGSTELVCITATLPWTPWTTISLFFMSSMYSKSWTKIEINITTKNPPAWTQETTARCVPSTRYDSSNWGVLAQSWPGTLPGQGVPHLRMRGTLSCWWGYHPVLTWDGGTPNQERLGISVTNSHPPWKVHASQHFLENSVKIMSLDQIWWYLSTRNACLHCIAQGLWGGGGGRYRLESLQTYLQTLLWTDKSLCLFKRARLKIHRFAGAVWQV